MKIIYLHVLYCLYVIACNNSYTARTSESINLYKYLYVLNWLNNKQNRNGATTFAEPFSGFVLEFYVMLTAR